MFQRSFYPRRMFRVWKYGRRTGCNSVECRTEDECDSRAEKPVTKRCKAKLHLPLFEQYGAPAGTIALALLHWWLYAALLTSVRSSQPPERRRRLRTNFSNRAESCLKQESSPKPNWSWIALRSSLRRIR